MTNYQIYMQNKIEEWLRNLYIHINFVDINHKLIRSNLKQNERVIQLCAKDAESAFINAATKSNMIVYATQTA